jgi:DNA-3-methyladenine glycosylase II
MKQAIDHLSQNHETFAAILKQYGLPNIPTRPQGFETLCKIILEQQVSLESARACYEKLLALVGDLKPENKQSLTEEQLRSCGLSRQKSKYVTALARAIVDKELDLESFSSKTAEEIRGELIKIKGIGHWTIDVYLMFSMQSPDIMPLGDIGIIITIKELWQIENKEEVLKLTET